MYGTWCIYCLASCSCCIGQEDWLGPSPQVLNAAYNVLGLSIWPTNMPGNCILTLPNTFLLIPTAWCCGKVPTLQRRRTVHLDLSKSASLRLCLKPWITGIDLGCPQHYYSLFSMWTPCPWQGQHSLDNISEPAGQCNRLPIYNLRWRTLSPVHIDRPFNFSFRKSFVPRPNLILLKEFQRSLCFLALPHYSLLTLSRLSVYFWLF